MKSRDRKSSKKLYHPPRLLIYGDLRTLTQAVKKKGPLPDSAAKMDMSKIAS
jgi:hypothetical protein